MSTSAYNLVDMTNLRLTLDPPWSVVFLCHFISRNLLRTCSGDSHETDVLQKNILIHKMLTYTRNNHTELSKKQLEAYMIEGEVTYVCNKY